VADQTTPSIDVAGLLEGVLAALFGVAAQTSPPTLVHPVLGHVETRIRGLWPASTQTTAPTEQSAAPARLLAPRGLRSFLVGAGAASQPMGKLSLLGLPVDPLQAAWSPDGGTIGEVSVQVVDDASAEPGDALAAAASRLTLTTSAVDAAWGLDPLAIDDDTGAALAAAYADLMTATCLGDADTAEFQAAAAGRPLDDLLAEGRQYLAETASTWLTMVLGLVRLRAAQQADASAADYAAQLDEIVTAYNQAKASLSASPSPFTTYLGEELLAGHPSTRPLLDADESVDGGHFTDVLRSAVRHTHAGSPIDEDGGPDHPLDAEADPGDLGNAILASAAALAGELRTYTQDPVERWEDDKGDCSSFVQRALFGAGGALFDPGPTQRNVWSTLAFATRDDVFVTVKAADARPGDVLVQGGYKTVNGAVTWTGHCGIFRRQSPTEPDLLEGISMDKQGPTQKGLWGADPPKAYYAFGANLLVRRLRTTGPVVPAVPAAQLIRLHFPVDVTADSVTIIRAQASTPGPIATDPADAVVWAPASAKLVAVASGALKYVPARPGQSAGALQIETNYSPRMWTKLVEDSDTLTSDRVPTTIYYENVDRTSAEVAIRDLIRATYGSRPPAPEETMLTDFFSGKWVGHWGTAPGGEPILQPLIVPAGASLGSLRPGIGTPPLAGTPNAVVLKLRRAGDAVAVDLLELAVEARRECRAEPDWRKALVRLGMDVLPVTTKTVPGQRLLALGYLLGQVARLRSALESDRVIFGTNPAVYQEYSDAANAALLAVTDAERNAAVLRRTLLSPCEAPHTVDFDLETLNYQLDVINAYRYLYHERLYAWSRLGTLSTVPAEYFGWIRDCDRHLAKLLQTAASLYATPHFAGRADIDTDLANTNIVAEQIHGGLTPEQLEFIRDFNEFAGWMLLIYGALEALVSATSRIGTLMAEIVANGGGGFGGGLNLVQGTVAFANGLGRSLTVAEIEALVNAGIIKGAAGTIVLMASRGDSFNPSGKTWSQAASWGQRGGRNWRAKDNPETRARWLEDENGVERVRFMPPDSRSSPWGRLAKGYWRLQNAARFYLNGLGEVPVFRKQVGGQLRDVAYRAGAGDAVPVQLTADRRYLLDGQRVMDLESQAFRNEITEALQRLAGWTEEEIKADMAQRATHIVASHFGVP
jgi:hypothetical protein